MVMVRVIFNKLYNTSGECYIDDMGARCWVRVRGQGQC